MKQIKLSHYHKSGKNYSVYLGNGTTNLFASLKDVVSFLSGTNNFLTDRLHDVHMCYVDVWNHFQQNWFYFDNNRKFKKAELYSSERECNNELSIVFSQLTNIANRSHFTNGNLRVFKEFFTSLNSLENVVRILSNIYLKHSNTNGIAQMDIVLRRLLFIRHELNVYGRRSTTMLFKIPPHISQTEQYIPDFQMLSVA